MHFTSSNFLNAVKTVSVFLSGVLRRAQVWLYDTVYPFTFVVICPLLSERLEPATKDNENTLLWIECCGLASIVMLHQCIQHRCSSLRTMRPYFQRPNWGIGSSFSLPTVTAISISEMSQWNACARLGINQYFGHLSSQCQMPVFSVDAPRVLLRIPQVSIR